MTLKMAGPQLDARIANSLSDKPWESLLRRMMLPAGRSSPDMMTLPREGRPMEQERTPTPKQN